MEVSTTKNKQAKKKVNIFHFIYPYKKIYNKVIYKPYISNHLYTKYKSPLSFIKVNVAVLDRVNKWRYKKYKCKKIISVLHNKTIIHLVQTIMHSRLNKILLIKGG